MRGLAALGLAVALTAALVGTAVMAPALSLLGVGGGAPAATAAATAKIPPTMRVLYQEAAATCPGLPWTARPPSAQSSPTTDTRLGKVTPVAVMDPKPTPATLLRVPTYGIGATHRPAVGCRVLGDPG